MVSILALSIFSCQIEKVGISMIVLGYVVWLDILDLFLGVQASCLTEHFDITFIAWVIEGHACLTLLLLI